jgi:hypothetical protein
LALKHKNKIRTRNENRLNGGFHLTMTNTGSIGSKCLNTTQGEKVPTQPLSYNNYTRRVKKCSCTDNSNPGRMNIVKNKLETSSSDYLKKKKSKVLLCDGVCIINGEVSGYTTRSACSSAGGQWSQEGVANITNDSGCPESETITYTVTVVDIDGLVNKYYIDGVETPSLTFIQGNTYIFDQSDSSNGTHPLRFYTDSSKTNIYSTGVETSGTPGSAGAYTKITVSDSTPLTLSYQCSAHDNMGGTITKKILRPDHKCNNKLPITKKLPHFNDASYVIEKRKSDLRKCSDIDGVDMPNNSCSA